MSSGGFPELLAFAREPAPNVTPVLAQYQRPSMNTAPAIDTANKFGMAQAQIAEANQVKDFNAQANPLRLKALQTEVQNGLDQQSASQRYQTLGKAQATDASAQYVLGQPEGEQTSAWNAAADTMVAHGIMTPDEAAKWKGVQPDQYKHYADGLHQTRGILENYMVSAGGKGSSYGTRGDGSAPDIKQAQSVYDTQYGKGTSKAQDAPGFDAFYRDQWPKWGAAQANAAPPPPASGGSDLVSRAIEVGRESAVGLGRMASDAYDWATGSGKPGAAPPESGVTKAAPPTAGAETAVNKAGSIKTDAALSNGAGGKSAADAIAYVGSPKDEAAQQKWFDAIPPGGFFQNPGFDPSKPEGPGNVRIGRKKPDETLQQAEGG